MPLLAYCGGGSEPEPTATPEPPTATSVPATSTPEPAATPEPVVAPTEEAVEEATDETATGRHRT